MGGVIDQKRQNQGRLTSELLYKHTPYESVKAVRFPPPVTPQLQYESPGRKNNTSRTRHIYITRKDIIHTQHTTNRTAQHSTSLNRNGNLKKKNEKKCQNSSKFFGAPRVIRAPERRWTVKTASKMQDKIRNTSVLPGSRTPTPWPPPPSPPEPSYHPPPHHHQYPVRPLPSWAVPAHRSWAHTNTPNHRLALAARPHKLVRKKPQTTQHTTPPQPRPPLPPPRPPPPPLW